MIAVDEEKLRTKVSELVRQGRLGDPKRPA